MTDMLIDKVYRFVMDEGLLSRGDPIIAGVSGGADSICLFFVLQEIAARMGCSLTAVHVHHGIRGDEADRDEAFVREICEEAGIPLRVYHGDVPALAAENHMSLEEAGRTYRYACLEEAAGADSAVKIAVAHHLDDQCETVLMNMMRGTGLRGMCGMPVKRGRIIRPLLCADRSEIEAFLERKGAAFQTDWTNYDTDYTRNRIRLELLPYLREHINPAADRHIAALAANLRDVSTYMDRQAEETACRIVSEKDGAFRISCEGLLACDRAVQRETLRYILEKAVGLKDIGQVHIESLRNLFSAGTGSLLDLPHELRAVKEYEDVLLRREGKGMLPDKPYIPDEIPVEIPGVFGGICFSLRELPDGLAEGEQIPKNRYTKWFDYDRINTELVLRHRREGDFMVIGNGQKKTLRRILIDDKVPGSARDGLLLLAEGSHIIWIPETGRISEAVKVTDRTKIIMTAQILREQDRSLSSGGRQV